MAKNLEKVQLKYTESTTTAPTLLKGELAIQNISGNKKILVGKNDGTTEDVLSDVAKKLTSPTPGKFLASGANGEYVETVYEVDRIVSSGSPDRLVSSALLESVKQEVQSGFDGKQSVLVATTEPLPSVVANGTGRGKTLTATANGLLVIDGNSTWVDIVNDGGSDNPYDQINPKASRALINNQPNAADNGWYVVNDKGSPTTKFSLIRALDADLDISAGSYSVVEIGTVNGGSAFQVSGKDPITIDTTPINLVPFNVGQALLAGVGLVRTGKFLSVKPDTTTNSPDFAQVINATTNGVSIGIDANLFSTSLANFLTMRQSSAVQDGYLAKEDWSTFNAKTPITTIQTIAVTGAVSAWDTFVKASGAISLTLPTPVGNSGKRVTIKKMDATGTDVTILPLTGTIEGDVNNILSTLNEAITLISDGTNYLIENHYSTVIQSGTY
jgi:hypothetical protein